MPLLIHSQMKMKLVKVKLSKGWEAILASDELLEEGEA